MQRENDKGTKSKTSRERECYSWKAKETPEWVIQLVRDMNGTEGPKLFFEKELTTTDIQPGQSRLLVPFNGLISNDFVTPRELVIMTNEDDNKNSFGAIVVNEKSQKFGVQMKTRKLKKQSGNGSWNYAIMSGWNDVLELNGLTAGDNISLWSFRWHQILSFALVRPPPPPPLPMPDSDGSSSLAPPPPMPETNSSLPPL